MYELLLPFVYGGKPWNIQRWGRDIRNRGGEKNGNVKEFSRQKKKIIVVILPMRGIHGFFVIFFFFFGVFTNNVKINRTLLGRSTVAVSSHICIMIVLYSLDEIAHHYVELVNVELALEVIVEDLVVA